MGNTIQKVVYPGPYPETYAAPTYDPHYGFSGERKKRVMPVTDDVLMTAKVPKTLRDYCAHYYLDYLQCYRQEFPFPQRCKAQLHHYHQCEYDDDTLRMKEYERERRLLLRQKRKQEASKAEAA